MQALLLVQELAQQDMPACSIVQKVPANACLSNDVNTHAA
jgi:hypothetical protein